MKRTRALPAALLVLCALSAGAAAEPAKQRMPITTTSPEARRLFQQGFDFIDRRRYADAYVRCRAAVAKDPAFAVAHLCMFITTGSKTERLEELRRAVSLADQVSEPERLWILSDDDTLRGDAVAEKAALLRIVELLPDDEHSYNLLAAYYYRRGEYADAITEYTRATKLAPSSAMLYNQLGYSYQFLGRYPEAEAAFRRYIALLPADPNPYDSYAELLMKMGNFAGSIQQYQKALAIDPKFATAFIGIGNDQLYLGQPAEARKTFARFLAVARNSEDQHQAWLWTALSFVHQGQTAEALAAMAKASAITEAAGDLRGVAGDLHLTGDILLEAGRIAEAAAQLDRQAATLARTPAPDEVKAAAARDARFDRGRLALARGDLAAARAERDALLREATAAQSKPSLFRAHELAGRVAIAEHRFAEAVRDLAQADPKDPRARYLLGTAAEAAGDPVQARAALGEVASWTSISPEVAFVRARARADLDRLAHGKP